MFGLSLFSINLVFDKIFLVLVRDLQFAIDPNNMNMIRPLTFFIKTIFIFMDKQKTEKLDFQLQMKLDLKVAVMVSFEINPLQ